MVNRVAGLDMSRRYIKPQCRMLVDVRGSYYLAGYIAGLGGVARNRRKRCERKAVASGYCWQHKQRDDIHHGKI